jgi:substrate-binding family protein
VDVEIVTDDVPSGIESTVAQLPADKSREILFGPDIADHAFDLASGDVEGGDQGLSAMAAILELTPLANEVSIGFITTLSTPAGYIGEDIRDGFRLAMTEEGGTLGGVPVKLVIADDALKPAYGNRRPGSSVAGTASRCDAGLRSISPSTRDGRSSCRALIRSGRACQNRSGVSH